MRLGITIWWSILVYDFPKDPLKSVSLHLNVLYIWVWKWDLKRSPRNSFFERMDGMHLSIISHLLTLKSCWWFGNDLNNKTNNIMQILIFYVFVYYFVPFSDVFILHESWAFFDYVEEQIRLHILVNVLNTLTKRNFYKHVQFDWINDQMYSCVQVCC